jgi:hypothetical protein
MSNFVKPYFEPWNFELCFFSHALKWRVVRNHFSWVHFRVRALVIRLTIKLLLSSKNQHCVWSIFNFFRQLGSIENWLQPKTKQPFQILTKLSLPKSIKRAIGKYPKIYDNIYSMFQEFSKAKSANRGSILSSSQFLILP